MPVEERPPFPPFTLESAVEKVRKAEDGWNSRNPEMVALAYTQKSRWRNRSEFVHGREEIVAFLARKWAHELDYRLIKELRPSPTTELPCGLHMNGTMPQASGFVLMETKTGCSMPAG